MPSIIRTSLQHHLWSEAQVNDEWASTRFWEHFIRCEFPGEDDWVVASQQPPTNGPGDLRRVELAVDRWTGTMIRRLFIFEAKKSKASQTEIDNLEYQGFQACLKHLTDAGRDQMYAMTTIGTSARLWVAHVDEDYLIPWVPTGASLSDKSAYIEAHSSDGSDIVGCWAYMKKNLEMSTSRLDKLRRALHTAVESNQPSSNDGAATPGPYTFNPQYGPSSEPSSSYPAISQSIPDSGNLGTGISYTLPIVQNSSTNRDASSFQTESAPASADTIFGGEASGRFSSPMEEVEDDPLIPDSAVFVEVELEKKGSGELYHFRVGRDKHKKASDDWKEGKVEYEGKTYPCNFCVSSQTGQYFWVWQLGDARPYSAAKGKGRR